MDDCEGSSLSTEGTQDIYQMAFEKTEDLIFILRVAGEGQDQFIF